MAGVRLCGPSLEKVSDSDVPEDPARAAVARRLRREPPTFRRVEVSDKEPINSRMMRITLTGDDLDGFAVEEPAASVRVLLPRRGRDELIMPEWNGNEFLFADGTRPPIRTFTPSLTPSESRTCDIFVVLHGNGSAAEWARTSEIGSSAALSGPGRGYEIDREAPAYLIGGDESAIPAIGQVLDALPVDVPARVFIEVADPDTVSHLPARAGTEVRWLHNDDDAQRPGAALVDAVTATAIESSEQVWVAGEAAAVQRIRRHLFDTVGLPRSQTTVRGYWKHGRAGT